MAFSNSFRMKQLNKKEYRYMQELIKEYSLDDPSELFNGLLRLHWELGELNFPQIQAEKWFTRILGEVRDKVEFLVDGK